MAIVYRVYVSFVIHHATIMPHNEIYIIIINIIITIIIEEEMNCWRYGKMDRDMDGWIDGSP